MIRKKVLSIGNNSATLLVQDTEANGALRVLRRVSVAGWSDADVKMVEKAYEELRQARLRGFVPVHTVLVQNSFLSIVASYAPEGDVTNYLEEEVDSPLEEQMVLRWLCACALSIHKMHAHKLFFPGLTCDRLFQDHQTGGSAQILLGVPLPLPVYFSQMQERRRSGVNVSLDYPTEVLAERGPSYHPTLSDVWCLGRLGEVLLTAKGTGMARRSGTTRQLISRMMANEAAKRPSMESVVQSLVTIAGNVKLGQPLWPVPVAASAAAQPPAPSAPPLPPPPPPAPDAPPPQVPRHRHNLGASHNSESSITSSPPPEVPTTRPHDSRRGPTAAATATAASAALPASPPPPPPPQAPQHRDAAARPPYAPDDSWHQRAQHQFQQLQRLNASPQKTRGGGVDGVVSPRGGALERRRSSEGKTPSPRRGNRGSGLLDNNTRMLNEMFAEQEELQQQRGGGGVHTVDDLHQLHLENVRQMKLETAQRQHEMRKHFTEWQRQNNQRLTDADNALVLEQDGILIVAPRPGASGPAQPPPSPPPLTGSSDGGGVEGQLSLAATTTTDDGTSDGAAQPHAPAPAKPRHTPRQKTPSSSSPLRRVTPKTSQPPSTRASGNAAPGGLTAAAAPLRGNASPHPPPPPMPQLTTVQPHARRSTDAHARTSEEENGTNERRHTAPAASATAAAASGATAGATAGAAAAANNQPPRRSSVDATTMSAVEWSIDGIRSALRTLVRSRDLYGEVMQEVAFFVNQREEARMAARTNEIFMQRLRKLLRDDRMFYGAVPLCAQLVALEGLDHTLRGSTGGRPSR